MKTIKIVALGCFHQYHLSEIKIPKGDILVLSGDYDANSPNDIKGRVDKENWLFSDLNALKDHFKHMVRIEGNHSTHSDPKGEIENNNKITLDNKKFSTISSQIESNMKTISNMSYYNSKRYWIEEIEGLNWLMCHLTPKIEDRKGGWRDPWAWHWFPNDLIRIKNLIKEKGKIDVIVSHGPPKGYNDRIWPKDNDRGEQGQHVGSNEWNEILNIYKPKLFIHSHIHEDKDPKGYVLHENGITKIYNVSINNDFGMMVNEPTIIKLKK